MLLLAAAPCAAAPATHYVGSGANQCFRVIESKSILLIRAECRNPSDRLQKRPLGHGRFLLDVGDADCLARRHGTIRLVKCVDHPETRWHEEPVHAIVYSAQIADAFGNCLTRRPAGSRFTLSLTPCPQFSAGQIWAIIVH